jgi:hypothetical protein
MIQILPPLEKHICVYLSTRASKSTLLFHVGREKRIRNSEQVSPVCGCTPNLNVGESKFWSIMNLFQSLV